jgi:hypothetical protein
MNAERFTAPELFDPFGIRRHGSMEVVFASDYERDIKALKAELKNWETWGIVEIATRNPNVAEYCKHWEERATKAEATALEPQKE